MLKLDLACSLLDGSAHFQSLLEPGQAALAPGCPGCRARAFVSFRLPAFCGFALRSGNSRQPRAEIPTGCSHLEGLAGRIRQERGGPAVVAGVAESGFFRRGRFLRKTSRKSSTMVGPRKHEKEKREKKKNSKCTCVGRESNPGQLLGRQLCSPLYHQRLGTTASFHTSC